MPILRKASANGFAGSQSTTCETFFISKGGKIVAHVIGAVSLAQIELGVRAAQTGREMPTDEGGGQIPLR